MKPTITLLKGIVLVIGILLQQQAIAQPPEKMSYQAVIRNNSNQLVTNTNIGIQISILQGSHTGTPVYIERHFPTTNKNGLISIEIGEGTIVSGSFTTIDWNSGTYFIKTEVDLNGGSNYTIEGTSQILSVPYALHAKTAETLTGELVETDPLFNAHIASNITESNVFNWNTAYGWGDHSTQGYLTSLSETDPVFGAHVANGITSENINNWNTAYGWGNHTALYKPIGYVPSWSEITSKPTFATVATSGNYSDLTNKPLLFDGSWNNLTGKPTFSTVATSGSYNDLINKPTIPTINDELTSTSSLWSSTKTYTEIEKKANVTDVYTKTNLQTSGQATIHYNNLSNKPANIDEDKTDDVKLTGNQTIYGNKIFDNIITANSGINTNNMKITNVSGPVNGSDAVNKTYVDSLIKIITDALNNAGIYGVVYDIEGNLYKTVKIGDQVWMAENMAYLPTVTPPSIQSATEPCYYVYDYDDTSVSEAKSTSNYKTYGVLYNWPAAMNGEAASNSNPSGVQGVCPSGWHLPSIEEWKQLEMYLGMSQSEADAGFWCGTDEGGKLKEAGCDHWLSPNTGATNSSGFTALPGGAFNSSRVFHGIGIGAQFWSTTQDVHNPLGFHGRGLNYEYQTIYHNGYLRELGFSVRCVKD